MALAMLPPPMKAIEREEVMNAFFLRAVTVDDGMILRLFVYKTKA
jgi:hypothetical protein